MRRIDADSDRMLLSVLRDDMDLTGAKYGCGEGQCAACTVLVDGVAAKSCITKLSAVAGKKIVTIEGLAAAGKLHPMQQAFLDHDALQCGYCTPGMILAGQALLARTLSPTRADIVDAISGNICRCTGYGQIVEAIALAAERLRAANVKPGEG